MTTHYEPNNPNPLAPAMGCVNGLILGLALDIVLAGLIAALIVVLR